jgi:translation elongation factor P/translation initiation factor 5A
MTVNVTEIKRGEILEIDGDPWQVTEVTSQSPSARGAAIVDTRDGRFVERAR